MKKILETLSANLHCLSCDEITEHFVDKIEDADNNDKKYIYYFGECSICGDSDEYGEVDLYREDES